MRVSEKAPRSLDKAIPKKEVDVRAKAHDLIDRHERKLKELRETALSSEDFHKAAMKSTEHFKGELKAFLKENGADELYDELVGFVSGRVSEIIKGSSDSSSLT